MLTPENRKSRAIQKIRSISDLIGPREGRGAVWLIVTMLAMAIFEVVGVSSVFPFLAVLGDPTKIEGTILENMYQMGGFGNISDFLFFLGCASFVFLLIAAIARASGQYLIRLYVNKLRHSIALRLFESFLFRPYPFFLKRHSSDLSKVIHTETQQLVQYVLMPMALLLSQGVVVISLISLMFFVNPIVAIVTISVLLAAYSTIFLSIRTYLKVIGDKRLRENSNAFRATSEAFGGIKIIKLNGHEQRYLSRYAHPSEKISHYSTMAAVLGTLPKYLIEVIAFGGLLLSSLFLISGDDGLEKTASGEILPLLGVYALAGNRILPALQTIFQSLTQLRFGSAIAEAIQSELATEKTRVRTSISRRNASLPRCIEVQNATFLYETENGSAGSSGIYNISTKFEVGKSYGIVGTSGAGKSTFVDVLLGLLPLQSGQITIDGEELRGENTPGFQGAIGYVPQEIYLLDDTVAANIAFGLSDGEIDMELVEAAARSARIHDFISNELPDGYNEIVGERGVRLSGGQRQRLGIARALYGNPGVLVFDEATSALDNETEFEVLRAIESLREQRIIIVIAHRLTTVRNCDSILVLEKGRLVDVGPYADLLKFSDVFRRIALNAAGETR